MKNTHSNRDGKKLLTVRKETLRNLNEDQLAEAAGGSSLICVSIMVSASAVYSYVLTKIR